MCIKCHGIQLLLTATLKQSGKMVLLLTNVLWKGGGTPFLFILVSSPPLPTHKCVKTMCSNHTNTLAISSARKTRRWHPCHPSQYHHVSNTAQLQGTVCATGHRSHQQQQSTNSLVTTQPVQTQLPLVNTGRQQLPNKKRSPFLAWHNGRSRSLHRTPCCGPSTTARPTRRRPLRPRWSQQPLGPS